MSKKNESNVVDDRHVWIVGTNTYFSHGATEQHVLNGDTWEVKTWNG